MGRYDLALIGFGGVNRALASMVSTVDRLLRESVEVADPRGKRDCRSPWGAKSTATARTPCYCAREEPPARPGAGGEAVAVGLERAAAPVEADQTGRGGSCAVPFAVAVLTLATATDGVATPSEPRVHSKRRW